MKTVHWEKLNIDVEIREIANTRWKQIKRQNQFSTKTDFKKFCISTAVANLKKVLEHITIYTTHYGVPDHDLYIELFDLVAEVNLGLNVDDLRIADKKKFKKPAKSTVVGSCAKECGETPLEQENTFEDVTREEILNLGERVTEIVVGQDKAIEKAIKAIQRASAGLRDPEQPIGSFLLTGPTGVGKTYFAKVLAKELTGSEANLIRVDCSEYQARHEVSKLIGAPHGYIGFDKGGVLTNAISERPFAVVLFDEIEKAHDTVFNLLLQIMDEGILTANVGTKHSFSQATILLTSNLGVEEAEKAKKEVGFGAKREMSVDDNIEAMEFAIRKKFRPEFLNRLDAVSHFMPLGKEDSKHIVKLELEKLLRFLVANKSIKVTYTQEVVDYLHEKGFDAEYGARPLRRCIRKDFANPLAYQVLVGTVEEGDTLRATMGDDGRVNFERVDTGTEDSSG
jgi:ATP-dependent Clp protease ATP-binding subunit ClpA